MTFVHPGHRLQNSLIALSVAMAVALCGLTAARPLPATRAAAVFEPMQGVAVRAADIALNAAAQKQALAASVALEIADAATQDAVDTVQGEIAEDTGSPPDDAKPRARPHRRSRQTLAMPYFSFAARS